jgi:hypothetical protein
MKADYNNIKEDGSTGAVNCAGSGGIEGIGVGPKGEPGVSKKHKKLRQIVMTKTPLTRIMPPR